MKLRLFADQCVPLEIIETLRQQGHEVLLLRDYLPVRSPDSLVIAKAQELESLLVSLNGDFSDIVAYPPASYGGILALQLHNHPEVFRNLWSTSDDSSTAKRTRKSFARNSSWWKFTASASAPDWLQNFFAR